MTSAVESSILRAHARMRDALESERAEEDPDDPRTVQAMPLVMEFPHDPLPDRRALLEAAATACVALCLDPRAGGDVGPDATFADALDRWYGARIRKIARRARNRRWLDVQELPGVTATVTAAVGGADVPARPSVARVRAFLPCPVSETPPAIDRLQIKGADLEPDATYAGNPEEVLASDAGNAAPVIYVDSSLGMTVGKAAAQVAHGSMLLAAAMTPTEALDWASDGFPLHVCEVGARRFADIGGQVGDRGVGDPPFAVVRDAGYTEVVPGSVTVVAMART